MEAIHLGILDRISEGKALGIIIMIMGKERGNLGCVYNDNMITLFKEICFYAKCMCVCVPSVASLLPESYSQPVNVLSLSVFHSLNRLGSLGRKIYYECVCVCVCACMCASMVILTTSIPYHLLSVSD